MSAFILDSLSSYCLIYFLFLMVIKMAAGTHEDHRLQRGYVHWKFLSLLPEGEENDIRRKPIPKMKKRVQIGTLKTATKTAWEKGKCQGGEGGGAFKAEKSKRNTNKFPPKRRRYFAQSTN
jgi:hypothetical protein